MSDPRDYKLDLSGVGEGSVGGDGAAASSGKRPYLSVHFACCSVYQRVYRDKDGRTYNGRCPRCGTPVRFVVGEGGTPARSFIVR